MLKVLTSLPEGPKGLVDTYETKIPANLLTKMNILR